jgi:rubredoxin
MPDESGLHIYDRPRTVKRYRCPTCGFVVDTDALLPKCPNDRDLLARVPYNWEPPR